MTADACAVVAIFFGLAALFAHLWWKERAWRKKLQRFLRHPLKDLRVEGEDDDGDE